MELEQVAALRAELEQLKACRGETGGELHHQQQEIDRLKLKLKEAEAKVAQDQLDRFVPT